MVKILVNQDAADDEEDEGDREALEQDAAADRLQADAGSQSQVGSQMISTSGCGANLRKTEMDESSKVNL